MDLGLFVASAAAARFYIKCMGKAASPNRTVPVPTPGRVLYTVHVNSDDESLARVFEIVVEDEWSDRLSNYYSRLPVEKVLREGSDVGELPMPCRECGKVAQVLVCGHNYCNLIAREDPKFHSEAIISIPVCTDGQDSECFIKAWQRVQIYCIKHLGRDDYHRERGRRPMICLNCGKRESDGARYLTCNRCAVAFYCSKECQVEGWLHKGHKKACRPIKETRAEYKK